MVNIVQHAILFQPFEHQGVYIRPSEMLLSNQGRPAQRLQFRYQRRIYISLLFRVLSTTNFWPSENHVSNQKRFFTCLVFYLLTENLYNCNLLKTVYRMSSPNVFSKKGVLLQICFILLEEYPYRSVISVELNSHFSMDVLL